MQKLNQSAYLLFFILFIIFSNAVFAEAPEMVNIYSKNTGKFEVKYSRAVSNASGAAIGGLIGAGIQAGVESGQDKEREKQVLKHLEYSACDIKILDSLKIKLQSKNVNVNLVDSKNNLENILEVDVKECGFKVVNTASMVMSSYAVVKFNYKQRKSAKVTLKEKIYLTGKDEFQFEEVVEDSERLNSEFERVLNKTGKRIANKILYL